ncbi:AAA family ATPase [Anoxynatronum sibiricum]|uniref:AAA family ATPase n=1 Tax=Anoxynatronum sibiricum TaxID=210623 RepID=A0ABU9VWT5_9CLOT
MIDNQLYQYIRSVELNIEGVEDLDRYPFCLDAVLRLQKLVLHPNVTFIIGENGSGKSTLLEAIAVAAGFNPEGGSKHFNFSTKDTHSVLANYVKMTKGVKMPQDGFFLRAESFYNVASHVDDLDEGTTSLLDAYGGKSLHEQSHGESFMSLMINRFRGNGLYILDEPEAALSPTRQFALLTRLHALVKADSQFIISTHSPILLAYPHSIIYHIDNAYHETAYVDSEYYQLYKMFLENPERMLTHLLEEE